MSSATCLDTLNHFSIINSFFDLVSVKESGTTGDEDILRMDVRRTEAADKLYKIHTNLAILAFERRIG
jgi:hypothetical protein